VAFLHTYVLEIISEVEVVPGATGEYNITITCCYTKYTRFRAV